MIVRESAPRTRQPGTTGRPTASANMSVPPHRRRRGKRRQKSPGLRPAISPRRVAQPGVGRSASLSGNPTAPRAAASQDRSRLRNHQSSKEIEPRVAPSVGTALAVTQGGCASAVASRPWCFAQGREEGSYEFAPRQGCHSFEYHQCRSRAVGSLDLRRRSDPGDPRGGTKLAAARGSHKSCDDAQKTRLRASPREYRRESIAERA